MTKCWSFLLVTLLVLVVGCRTTDPFAEDPTAAVHTTRPPWNSTVFAAQTDSGVVLIDLGWSGRPQNLLSALAPIGARPDDVRRVFLTHSHRDHIALWPWVAKARFHLSALEVPYFLGEAEHVDSGSSLAERFHSTDYPAAGRLTVDPFANDTAFVLGTDTLWAVSVPGHTAGSAAYVFRGIAFLGDAISDDIRGSVEELEGFFSADVEQGRKSLARFISFVDSAGVEVSRVCTAHGPCVLFSEFREEFRLR